VPKNISKAQPNWTLPSWNGGRSKLATIAGSGPTQKFTLICQLFMESQHSNCRESINRFFYNIYPISGSLNLVLTSPDAEIAPQNLIPPAFILPLVSPLSTTVRTTWNGESRPVFHAESACQLHLRIEPLVVALKVNAAKKNCVAKFCMLPIFGLFKIEPTARRPQNFGSLAVKPLDKNQPLTDCNMTKATVSRPSLCAR